MDRVLNRAWNVVRRTGAARPVGTVYVPDRMASVAERRYFDSLVGTDAVRRDPNAALVTG
jgi:hypothetical protein